MHHKMTLYHSGFYGIKTGKQQIECRLYDKKRKKVKIGDTISFTKLPEKDEEVTVKVVGLLRFKTFKNMFKLISKDKFGYSKNTTLQQQVKGMKKYYSLKQQKQNGVLGIYVKLVKQ